MPPLQPLWLAGLTVLQQPLFQLVRLLLPFLLPLLLLLLRLLHLPLLLQPGQSVLVTSPPLLLLLLLLWLRSELPVLLLPHLARRKRLPRQPPKRPVLLLWLLPPCLRRQWLWISGCQLQALQLWVWFVQVVVSRSGRLLRRLLQISWPRTAWHWWVEP